jgi:hypothetical protein
VRALTPEWRQAFPDAAEREDAFNRTWQEWRWGNLTKLGVANFLRRAGFRMEYAIRVAEQWAAGGAKEVI